MQNTFHFSTDALNAMVHSYQKLVYDIPFYNQDRTWLDLNLQPIEAEFLFLYFQSDPAFFKRVAQVCVTYAIQELRYPQELFTNLI